jgi:hypothetical protein
LGDDGKLAEKDVDATAAALEEALKAGGTPLPLKVIIGVVRMVLRHIASQGTLEPEYAELDELHRRRQLEQLVCDAAAESFEPSATAALGQLDAKARIDGRLDLIVELLSRLVSDRFDPKPESARPIIQQQIIIQPGATANIGDPRVERSSCSDANFEGPVNVGSPIQDLVRGMNRGRRQQSFRVIEFLNIHLGKRQNRIPFVGRESPLDHLDDWLSDC